jgi:hypothetical protein
MSAAVIATSGKQAKSDNREKEFLFHNKPRFLFSNIPPFFTAG